MIGKNVYEAKYCAYVDILGFTELIDKLRAGRMTLLPHPNRGWLGRPKARMTETLVATRSPLSPELGYRCGRWMRLAQVKPPISARRSAAMIEGIIIRAPFQPIVRSR